MSALIQVVLPVFLVAAAGYVFGRLKLLSDSDIDGLNRFTQSFGVPCLLFGATLHLDLGAVFDPKLLIAFFTGNTLTFALGIIGARMLFKRRPGEAVAIGFGALFSNSVIIGIPIVERAFGPEALAASFAIIAVHAPYCYLLGITAMEVSRADGRSLRDTGTVVLRAMLHNPLMIGLGLGLAGNLMGLELHQTVWDGISLVSNAALPTALFGLGAVLTRYNLSRSVPEAALISVLSLIVHPAITYGLAHLVFDLPPNFVRGAVMTAAMAPGVSTYIFASMYDRAVGAAASTVLLATLLSVLSVSVWLQLLAAL